MKRFISFLLGLSCLGILAASPLEAQTTSFKQINLTSDTPGLAARRQPDLLNPWGLAFLPGQSFMVAVNSTGYGKRLDRNGAANMVLITGTSGDLSHSTAVTLNVQ